MMSYLEISNNTPYDDGRKDKINLDRSVKYNKMGLITVDEPIRSAGIYLTVNQMQELRDALDRLCKEISP